MSRRPERPTEEMFRKDVSGHSMRVLKDDGVYRHLEFSNKGSFNMLFNLVTWPGYLAYSGDMGCFVFCRLHDMFQFFRHGQRGDKLYINPQYWGEKLEAGDKGSRGSDYRIFSADVMRERVREQLATWIEEYAACNRGHEDFELMHELSKEDVTVLSEEIDDLCRQMEDADEYGAYRAVRDFDCKLNGRAYTFHDAWEWDCREYTYRFIWCCYAIVWAIEEYDLYKAGDEEKE